MKKKQIIGFQALRGFSILLIFVSHCEYLWNVDGVNRLTHWGGAGVSIFICLSGFLTYMKRMDGRQEKRVLKKLKKFYPLHIITLLLAIPPTINALKESPLTWFAKLLVNLTLTQTLIPRMSVYYSFNAVSWYLSITMIFIILTPWAQKFWDILDKRSSIIFLFAVNLFEFVLCTVTMKNSYQHWIIYVFPLTRFLDFLGGGGYCNRLFSREARS